MDVGMMHDAPVDRAPGDTRPLVELYDEAIADILDDEKKGFDFFTVGEHHFMESQWNPSPLLILAAVARQTSRIRMTTNVLLTPLYHPVRLAEDVATLDLLSNGRMNLVCGTGSIRSEFETLGVEGDERFGRTWETMDLVRRAFSEPQFDYNGRYHQYPNIRMTTEPVQKPFPIWFGGVGPKNLARAGREGFHVLGSVAASSNWELYLQELRAAGRKLEDFNAGVTVYVSTVSSEGEIEAARAKALVAAQARSDLYTAQGRGSSLARSPSDHRRLPVSAGIAGTPDQVLKELEPQFKESIFTHFLLRTTGPKEPFAGEVLPVLRTWGRQPVAGTAAG